MATLSTDSRSGSKVIQFPDPASGTRRTLRIGKMAKRDAQGFRLKIERLVFCKLAGTSPEPSVAEWVAGLDTRIHGQLVKWGLIGQRKEVADQSVLEFVDGYLKLRTDVKPRTRVNHLQARGFLEKYFGTGKRLADVTILDGKQFRAWMISQGHSENYIRSQCKNLKLFFGAAVEGRLITENPFKGLPCKIMSVPERLRFIRADDVKLILQHAPDIEWRIVISLARWGGLRIPSEIGELKLTDINWETNRITIHQPKLEHIPGKAFRVIPLFPELLEVLREAAENAPDGAVYLLPRLRGELKNLRTTFNKIVTRAGLTPWTKPFGNMRSTRATELA